MIDIVGKILINKQGQKYKVLMQNETYIFLDDGNSYKYYESFISGNFTMYDSNYQKLIERDVLNSVGIKKPEISRAKNSYELDNNIIYVPMTQDFANVNFKISDGLEAMHSYGNVAQDIYRECCSCFGWDYSAVGYFAKMKILYCENVTPEGYAAWFLPHSNLNDSESNRWKNLISYDFNYIKEYWKDIDSTFDMFVDGDTTRVAFAKQANQKYIFLGLYVCDYIDYDNYVKIYKRVDLKYPN